MSHAAVVNAVCLEKRQLSFGDEFEFETVAEWEGDSPGPGPGGGGGTGKEGAAGAGGGVPWAVRQLARAAMARDPAERPSFEDIMEVLAPLAGGTG